jgi:hypothetical protein
MDNLHVRLNFNLVGQIAKFGCEMSKIAKFGWEMIESLENITVQNLKSLYYVRKLLPFSAQKW